MVKVTKGVLLKTETAIKEVILKLDETYNFIIEDINETSLFVKEDCVNEIKAKVDKIVSGASKAEIDKN